MCIYIVCFWLVLFSFPLPGDFLVCILMQCFPGCIISVLFCCVFQGALFKYYFPVFSRWFSIWWLQCGKQWSVGDERRLCHAVARYPVTSTNKHQCPSGWYSVRYTSGWWRDWAGWYSSILWWWCCPQKTQGEYTFFQINK